MSSTSASNGVVQIQVTFEIGTNVDKAALNVNNRVKQVEPRLPEEVRRQGVTVERGSLVVPAGARVLLARRPLRRPLHVELRDAERARRAEAPARARPTCRSSAPRTTRCASGCKPDRLAQLKLTPADVIARGQRAERAVRRRQDRPVADRRRARSSSTRSPRKGRLADPKEFEHIIVRANPDGSTLRLRDVARVELGSQGLRLHRPLQRQAGDAGRHLPAAGRQRARRRRRTCKTTMAGARAALSRGPHATPFPTTRRASSRCRSARC